MLFFIYLRNLPRTPDTTITLYADGGAVQARFWQPGPITRRLQAALDDLEEWYTRWRIAVSPETSTAILLTKRRHEPEGQLSIFGRRIPWRTEAKYLGVMLGRQLT